MGIQMKLIFSYFLFLADCRLWYHTENFENCREICSLNRNCRLWNWKTATIHELNCQLFTYSQHLGPMVEITPNTEDIKIKSGKMEWHDMFKPQPGKDAEDVELDEVIQKTMAGK